jgi:hypothetical protein
MNSAEQSEKETVRADIRRGALHPYISIFDYGKYADREVRAWLGLPTWTESWRNNPTIIRRPKK